MRQGAKEDDDNDGYKRDGGNGRRDDNASHSGESDSSAGIVGRNEITTSEGEGLGENRIKGPTSKIGDSSNPPQPLSPQPPTPDEGDLPLDEKLVTFTTIDVTSSERTIGEFHIITKNSISKIELRTAELRADWAELGQARLGWLLSQAADTTAEKALLKRIKTWCDETVKDEAAHCCVSAQAWTRLQDMTGANLLIGAQPITAGTAFLTAWTNTTDRTLEETASHR